MLTFITGGARSGKSGFAQKSALGLSENPIYIATAKVWDTEFEQRVNRHKADRGPEWTSIEAFRKLASLPIQGKIVVIDCVTLWLTNLYVEHSYDIEACLHEFKQELDDLLVVDTHIFLISNELGMGLHAETEMGRKFTDLQGWANQYAANKADEVVFMVSGIPMYIKKQENE
ncbi:MAG: bifunctional adenosylcobinamide kinase/adenosylcobinamide-phosphate guanylyltransferase [Cytophagales bacterium]|nr:bifunctional adenosylcobinamide kinase/adenosylcobinamide-phosphate guanylyltransferase [Cytophagales bacterium]